MGIAPGVVGEASIGSVAVTVGALEIAPAAGTQVGMGAPPGDVVAGVVPEAPGSGVPDVPGTGVPEALGAADVVLDDPGAVPWLSLIHI